MTLIREKRVKKHSHLFYKNKNLQQKVATCYICDVFPQIWSNLSGTIGTFNTFLLNE